MRGEYLGKGAERKQGLGELLSYQQIPLSRMTTTFCLLPPTSPNHHLYLPKYEAGLRKLKPTKVMGFSLQWESGGESRCQSPALPQLLPPWVLLTRGLMGLGPVPDDALEGAGELGSLWASLSAPLTPQVTGSSYCLEPVGWNPPSLLPSQAIITCAFPVPFPACRGKVGSGGKVRCQDNEVTGGSPGTQSLGGGGGGHQAVSCLPQSPRIEGLVCMGRLEE